MSLNHAWHSNQGADRGKKKKTPYIQPDHPLMFSSLEARREQSSGYGYKGSHRLELVQNRGHTVEKDTNEPAEK